MRGKRAKQYRKLMQQYSLTFGFREPYQVLLDADIIQDAARFKMDLIKGLERSLHGKVKPMITQCSIRHLYTAEPRVPNLVEQAKTYERRRCNHHELDNPLTTLECLSEVVDPKSSKTNKHKYIVASQDADVRAHMREIPGVPLVYINRSVMIMEPMASATEQVREREEKGKFRAGLKGGRGAVILGKRAREDSEDAPLVDGRSAAATGASEAAGSASSPNVENERQTTKKRRGPKGPNPLSVKKSKKKVLETALIDTNKDNVQTTDAVPTENGKLGDHVKRKRKRKHKGDKTGDLEVPSDHSLEAG